MEQEYPLARTSGKTFGTSYLADTKHLMAIRGKQPLQKGSGSSRNYSVISTRTCLDLGEPKPYLRINTKPVSSTPTL